MRGPGVADAVGAEPEPFDAVVGIDWSGAASARLPGLRVARRRRGESGPALVDGPRSGGLWRREDVLSWLVALVRSGARALVGIDFAFAYAHADAGAYFPGLADPPADAVSLWSFVDGLAGDAADLYGGGVYGPASPVAGHYLTPAGRGARYTLRRRRTEEACAAVTSPHPVFKCVGAANVGTGSLAGMRLLARLRSALGAALRVWPLAGDAAAPLTVVEIFPRLYFRLAGQDPRAWRDRRVVDATLAWFGSAAPPPAWRPRCEDEADAVVSAAALHHLATRAAIWHPPALTPEIAATEGWIFGVDAAPGARPAGRRTALEACP